MTSSPNNTNSKIHLDFEALKSYIFGFILSLFLTFVSYFIVVSQSMDGSSLRVAILAFAVSQMLIQIIFFLHLGRGPKPLYNVVFFVATVGIILVVVGGSVMIINNLHYNMQPVDQTKKLANDEGIYQIKGEMTGACQAIGNNHKITITNGQVNPEHTTARKCDTLTFINEDDKVLAITFGIHPEHGVYAGINELSVRTNRSKSITLSELGSYKFHNHFQAGTTGYFTVEP